jgi:predicted phosphate transport protein (TIGR00153 family)
VLRLIPKDEEFFDFFERTAANLHEAAILLDRFMTEFTDVEDRARQIHNAEHSGDNFTREAIEKLHKTFITPFDREDIYVLVCRMDDALDQMDAAAARMVLYKVKEPTDDARALGKVLIKSTQILKEIMPMLRSLKQPQVVLNRCLEAHAQEAEADRIEQRALARLFETADPVEVIKWKDIYEDLETATDRCEDVANVIEAIVLRHA